jgi:hypothetical protein
LARRALEDHAASHGHPSVEAWLRALTPPHFDSSALDHLFPALVLLNPEEQEAAADLLFAFGRDVPANPGGRGLFHPSLLAREGTTERVRSASGQQLLPGLFALVTVKGSVSR